MVSTAATPFALPPAAALPVERVFVLKLTPGADDAPLQGRLEHLVSGRQADFGDLGDLRELLAALGGGTQPGLA